VTCSSSAGIPLLGAIHLTPLQLKELPSHQAERTLPVGRTVHLHIAIASCDYRLATCADVDVGRLTAVSAGHPLDK
jgi:hypothetical protein